MRSRHVRRTPCHNTGRCCSSQVGRPCHSRIPGRGFPSLTLCLKTYQIIDESVASARLSQNGSPRELRNGRARHWLIKCTNHFAGVENAKGLSLGIVTHAIAFRAGPRRLRASSCLSLSPRVPTFGGTGGRRAPPPSKSAPGFRKYCQDISKKGKMPDNTKPFTP